MIPSSRTTRLASLVALTATGMLLAALPAATSAAPFTGLYVFGDSLSDNGNLLALTEQVFGAGNGVPSAPYFQGRFSNGPVAVEYLAAGLGLAAGQLHDMAIAGATSGVAGRFPDTGLQNQVADYLTALGPLPTDNQALYVVWAGANDFLHGDLNNYPSIISAAVSNLTTAVSHLHAAGATDFLLALVPDLGATPRANAFGPAAAGFLTFVSGSFNDALRAGYAGLANSWTDEHFHYFDTPVVQLASMAAAAAAGKNITDACFDADVPSLCANNGANYYYFDDIHPTTGAHQALAAGMLAAVPEPQTMLMMAAGLLALLAAARRRA